MQQEIKKAWQIAKEVHKDQKRFNHQPYINHVKEVVKILKELGFAYEPNIIIPAILHDTVEDGGFKYQKIIGREFTDDIALRVYLLTHYSEFSYEKYIERMLHVKDCVIIKIADMLQNLTETPKERQKEKYRKAFPMLIKAIMPEKD